MTDDQGDVTEAWPDASSAERAVGDLRAMDVPEESALGFCPWVGRADVHR